MPYERDHSWIWRPLLDKYDQDIHSVFFENYTGLSLKSPKDSIFAMTSYAKNGCLCDYWRAGLHQA